LSLGIWQFGGHLAAGWPPAMSWRLQVGGKWGMVGAGPDKVSEKFVKSCRWESGVTLSKIPKKRDIRNQRENDNKTTSIQRE